MVRQYEVNNKGMATSVLSTSLAGSLVTLVIFGVSLLRPDVNMPEVVVAALVTIISAIIGYFTGPPKEDPLNQK